MASIVNSGFGFIVVDSDPNSAPAIVPNQGEDSEMAWLPTANQMWYYDRGTSAWLLASTSSSSFTITDGTTPQVIEDGNTLTIADSDGITLVTSATDTLTATIVIDPATGNSLVKSATGLYVPDEVVTNAGVLTGAAPAGAQWGVDTTNSTTYYVNGSGDWTALPTSYSFSVTDGTTTETITTGNSLTFSDSNNLNFTVAATDTVSVDLILDPAATNTLTTSATGLNNTLNIGDGITGAGTTGSALNLNIDGTTAGNAAVITAGQGLYVPNEVVTGTTALAGTAPAGAEWGINTTDGTIYYVNGAGNWAGVPVQYSFTVTDGTTTETVSTGDSLTFTDSATIDFTVSATDAITAGVKLSATAGNDITSNADGIYLDVTAQETPILFTTDTTATGVALSGVNEHTIDITLLSTDANNALTIGSDGGLEMTINAAAANDVAAGVAGVAIGGYYELSNVNTYGLPEGLLKIRRN